jgi:shikimate dehydrogenase
MPRSLGTTISPHTRLLAVLGHPVGHSLSPAIHNAALRSQGVDAVYLAFDVEPADLAAALDGLRAVGFWGANVTVPHKERAAELVDSLDPLASRVGAINTIANQEGRMRGYNTDIAGFAAALEVVRPAGATGARCLVAGAGGAARAVVAALTSGGAADVQIFNRTTSRAEQLCRLAEGWGGAPCKVVQAGDLPQIAAQADVIVNATSVGLGSLVKESPIPVDILDSHHIVLDLVYGPERTELVRGALRQGAVAVDGREMLVMQAASSYQLWTGIDAPIDVMRANVEKVGR